MKRGQFVIIDLRNMDFMKDKDGKICVYDTEEDASVTCGMYEFEDAWVMELKYNHIEEDIDDKHFGVDEAVVVEEPPYDNYKHIRKEEDYSKLLKSGMFWEFYPELCGQWEQDKIIINGL